jgi:hypothetical protein
MDMVSGKGMCHRRAPTAPAVGYVLPPLRGLTPCSASGRLNGRPHRRVPVLPLSPSRPSRRFVVSLVRHLVGSNLAVSTVEGFAPRVASLVSCARRRQPCK